MAHMITLSGIENGMRKVLFFILGSIDSYSRFYRMSWKKPTAGIILAAGESVRYGQTKQLILLKNKPMIDWVLEAALGSRLEQVILVLGHDHQKIVQALGSRSQHPRLQISVNPDYQKGQGSSLKFGFSAMPKKFPSVMFILGDQPMVGSETIDVLLQNFWRSDKNICVPVCQGQRGNPTIFSRAFYEHFFGIKGDIGAREIIKTYADEVLEVDMKNPLCFIDIDTEKDFEQLQSHINGLLPKSF
jgi:molybdenum cofactor cytidylyltransferase